MDAQIVLGVSGGIAAYKACELLRLFTESGASVRVIPTAAGLEFVGAATWEALSGMPVTTDVFTGADRVPHVEIGRRADLVVVAPATADLLSRAAVGAADDLLTATLLTARCPVVFVPAMHTEMWEHPATRENVATLRARGTIVLEPATGRLTGADTGKGRLPDPSDIYATCVGLLSRGVGSDPADLAGRRVVVSAGGTREFLDPVRYLGNRSSGKQGYALARAAAARGATVTLVAANVSPEALPVPSVAELVRVETTGELAAAVKQAARTADAVVMAAAPADFRPATYADHKIKKADDATGPDVELVPNPDILADLVRERDASASGRVLVGFGAETGDETGSVIEHGRAKLARKGCDLLVVNEVGRDRGFEADENAATILAADGTVTDVPRGPKDALAHRIWDLILERFPAHP